MQFLLIAYDGTDNEALQRRLNVREEHLKKIGLLKRRGECLFGGAILDEVGKMIGSTIVYDFPDRHLLDEKLKEEPYMVNDVWKSVEIKHFRLAKL